jgi:hypothetical protein
MKCGIWGIWRLNVSVNVGQLEIEYEVCNMGHLEIECVNVGHLEIEFEVWNVGHLEIECKC